MIEWMKEWISKKSRWGNGLRLIGDRSRRPRTEVCSWRGICSALCWESPLGLSPWWPASCPVRSPSTVHRSSPCRRPSTRSSVFQDPSYRCLCPTLFHSGYRSCPSPPIQLYLSCWSFSAFGVFESCPLPSLVKSSFPYSGYRLLPSSPLYRCGTTSGLHKVR